MKSLKKQYDRVLLKNMEVLRRLAELTENEIIKKYLELASKNEQLLEQAQKLYIQIKCEEYTQCNHIWVRTFRSRDESVIPSHQCHGCIKCGLDQKVNYFGQLNDGLLSFDQKIVYDFLLEDSKCPGNIYYKGIDTFMDCDLDLAKAIYSKIMKVYPDIDDEAASKYFCAALHNIRKTDVSASRETNRAIRLYLSPSFSKWNSRY